MTVTTPIRADFVDQRTVKTRSVMQLIFEIQIENADEVLKALGGIPQPAQDRPCAIVLLNE